MFDLSEALGEAGHEIVPFACRGRQNLETPFLRYFAPDRDYAGGGISGKIRNAMGVIYDGAARRQLARLLDDHRPDVAHLHNIYHQLSPSILFELRKRRIPVVMTLHDYKLACPCYLLFRDGEPCEDCVGSRLPLGCGIHRCSHQSRVESWVLSIESTLHRWGDVYRKNVDRFICPSHFMAAVMKRHGIDTRQLKVIVNAPRKVPAAGEIQSKEKRPTLLYAGRLSPEKGVGHLIEVAAQVEPLQLWIAGDGPEKEALQRKAAGMDGIHFLGKLSAGELANVRQESWAVALPSIWHENAPMSLLEAYGDQRPVLASDLGGMTEMIEDRRTGRLLPPADTAAWTQALSDLCTRPQEWASMGENGRQLLERRYAFADFLAGHLQLYEEILR